MIESTILKCIVSVLLNNGGGEWEGKGNRE
jgi:hypothetical protein